MKLGKLFEQALKDAEIEPVAGSEFKIKIKKEKGHLRLIVDDITPFEEEILQRSRKITGKESAYTPHASIGKKIHAIRIGLGLSLAEVAAKAKISKGSLCSIEKDKRPVGLQVMKKIAAALGIHINSLMI